MLKYIFRDTVSEGRISIRESLRIYLKIEAFLGSNRNHDHWTFESLVYQASNNLGINSGTFSKEISCGNTMKSFLSIFLSKSQITNRILDNKCNGSNINVMMKNPNIMFFSLFSMIQRYYPTYMKSYDTTILSYIYKVNSYIAQRSFNKFSKALGDNDSHLLPRIFLCNIIFINEKLAMTTSYNLDAIKDHKFTIIKHSNDDDDYQIIQGYRDHHDLKGFNLINNKSKLTLETFLALLNEFGSNRSFNSNNYNRMFGVNLEKDNDQHCWTSFSVEELEDDDIQGSGGREVATEIELMIDNIKT